MFLGESCFLLKQLLEEVMMFLGDCSRGGEKAPVTPHYLGRPSSDSCIDYLASSFRPCPFLQIAQGISQEGGCMEDAGKGISKCPQPPYQIGKRLTLN